MKLWILILLGIACLIVLCLKPLRPLLRAVCRTGFGFAALAAIHASGFGIGVNLANALLFGVLGIPGACTALALHFLL